MTLSTFELFQGGNWWNFRSSDWAFDVVECIQNPGSKAVRVFCEWNLTIKGTGGKDSCVA